MESPAPHGAAAQASGWRRDGPRFVLVCWLLASVALVVASACAGLAVALPATVRAALAGERSSAELTALAEQALATEAFTWSALLLGQAAVFASAVLACRALRKPAGERLGLGPSGLTIRQGAVLVAATVVPFALGLLLATLVERALGPADADTLGLQRMWSEGARASSVAWILAIALVPGFVEETFYRGLLLRGLRLRFGPWTSILVTSTLFAASHGGLAWAAGIFPLGLWLGVVAWRTDSVRMSFVLHASLNGLWTASMMVLHRDPTRESLLNGLAIAALVLGALAFPWALVILRRAPALAESTRARAPRALFPRLALVVSVAAALLCVLVPPGAAPQDPGAVRDAPAPALAELEANATASVACVAAGEAGAVEFALEPGRGVRVALPQNRVGLEHVIVALDASERTVWLAYAGERSSKGGPLRPLGIVEQLASGDPTTLCLTLTPGPPPVRVRLTLEVEEAGKLAAFARAEAEGWARRGRK